mgnify:CR=1 FL=1
MAKKFTIDTSIAADIKSAASDSFKDSIRMIELEKIKLSMDNFYSLSDIEILADDIERQGLKHNIVVVEDSENRGTYFIKSGHRRFTAIQRLVNENRYNSKYIPCFVDGIKSKSETVLDLIMLNATTRVMTDSELFKQYENLKETLENLKHEGIKIKGRLREKVAEMLNVSPAQVGKIENIKHNAVPEIIDAVESGDMTIATADSIAKLPEQEQEEIIAETPVEEITTKAVKEHKEKTKKKAVKKSEEKIVTDDDILLMEITDEESSEEEYFDNDISTDDDTATELSLDETSNVSSNSLKNDIENFRWAKSLSKEQIAYLFETGWYNNAMKGLIIATAENAGMEKEVYKLLKAFNAALSDYNKEEAEQLYKNK